MKNYEINNVIRFKDEIYYISEMRQMGVLVLRRRKGGCKLVTVQDLQDIIEVLVRLEEIHDLYKDEEGNIQEREYNIKEKIANYYLSRRGR